MIRLEIVDSIAQRLREKSPLIQVVLGPRQVGKTTAIQQLRELEESASVHYASADDVLIGDRTWLMEQWSVAEAKGTGAILVVDEIQKVDNWSETVKKLWDAGKRQHRIKVVLLGSSSLAIQTGLSESLTGRFELLRAFHWNFLESQRAFGFDLETYLTFGGYPGSAPFRSDLPRWLSYMRESVVETVLGKDIQRLRTVTRPALFRQVFQLICHMPAREISLRKILGQLQDAGSVETVKHYIELFEGAFLMRALQKYSTNPIQKKSSSPKLLPLCPAFYTFAKGDSDHSSEEMGRLFELVVGADLCRLPGQLSYWREGDHEVDFVYVRGKHCVGIEVKYGKKRGASGLSVFEKKFPRARSAVIVPENYVAFARNPEAFLGF